MFKTKTSAAKGYPFTLELSGSLVDRRGQGNTFRTSISTAGEELTVGATYSALLEAAYTMRGDFIEYLSLLDLNPWKPPGYWYVSAGFPDPMRGPEEKPAYGAGSAIRSPDELVRSIWHYTQLQMDAFVRDLRFHGDLEDSIRGRIPYQSGFALEAVDALRSTGYTGEAFDQFLLSLGPGVDKARRHKAQHIAVLQEARKRRNNR